MFPFQRNDDYFSISSRNSAAEGISGNGSCIVIDFDGNGGIRKPFIRMMKDACQFPALSRWDTICDKALQNAARGGSASATAINEIFDHIADFSDVKMRVIVSPIGRRS